MLPALLRLLCLCIVLPSPPVQAARAKQRRVQLGFRALFVLLFCWATCTMPHQMLFWCGKTNHGGPASKCFPCAAIESFGESPCVTAHLRVCASSFGPTNLIQSCFLRSFWSTIRTNKIVIQLIFNSFTESCHRLDYTFVPRSFSF